MVLAADKVVSRKHPDGSAEADKALVRRSSEEISNQRKGSRVAGGKIQEGWQFMDALGLHQQLGLALRPARAKAKRGQA